MYTQCPDCNTAFRVTAEVLKQAAGKVRCGGCSNAFNALEYLSEKTPQQSRANDRGAAAPELSAEPRDNDDGSPVAISAEQSAALMKTLDQLAGSDIRIEDTGVEWRVLDDDEDSDFAMDDESNPPSDVEELRFDDNTPLPEDFDAGDTPGQQPELVDVDEPATGLESGSDPEPAHVSLGEPGEWADILDEVDSPIPPREAPLDAELAALEDAEKPPDVDTQFALQAAEMGIDLSGSRPTTPEVNEDIELESDDESTRKHNFDDPVDVETDEEPEEEPEDKPAPLEFGSVETAIRELEDQSDVFDADFFDAAVAAAPDDESDGDMSDEPVVAPLSDEEQSLNMMIDEDLMNLAVEDDDGFASTIVIAEESAEARAIAEKIKAPSKKEHSTGFESIVMEGDFASNESDTEKQEADIAAAAILVGQAADERKEESFAYSIGKRRLVAAVIVVLTTLLMLQVVHQSREELATIPAFNKVASPIYRTIGMPLSPAWDVSGWRFEATYDELEGNADTGEEQLNISPRVGNASNQPLPYPLISVSLTDRFEDTIGSRVLEPADYLIDGLDPRKLVQPGETFDAAIAIQSPAKEAAGYKLKVCYRLSNGQLRCNVPVFK